MEWNIKHYARTKSVLTYSIDPLVGSKIEPFFSESSHGVYEINGNGAYSTMHTHILSLHTHTQPLWWGQKVKPFFH